MANGIEIVTTAAPVPAPACRQAPADKQLVEMWLHGLSRHTQRAYRKDYEDFQRLVDKPLHNVALADVLSFADSLEALRLAPGTRHRKLSAVKSLFAYSHRVGYLQFDVARPVRVPAVRETLNERILEEREVHLLLGAETGRNRVMLELLYVSGVRVSELTALAWRDAQPRAEGGQVTVFGKGGKTRTVLLPRRTWSAMLAIRGTAGDEAPVFPSRRGGHLDPSQVLRIVRAAAKKAGIAKAVSPHWLRHCHCSHALDRGAPLHLVQATAGHSNVAVTSRYLHSRPTDSSSRYLGF